MTSSEVDQEDSISNEKAKRKEKKKKVPMVRGYSFHLINELTD
jgi:hypothetical protein